MDESLFGVVQRMNIFVRAFPGSFNFEATGSSPIIDADDLQRKEFEIRGRPTEEHPVIIG